MLPTIHGIAAQVSAAAWYDGAYAAWQAKGAASLAASYLDLTGNGRNLTVGVAPTLGANGWTFNGSTQYLITPIIPDSRDWTYLIAFDSVTLSGGEKSLLGNRQETPTRRIIWIQPYPATPTVRQYRNGGVGSTNVATAVSEGVLGMAGTTTYYNGAADGTISSNNTYPAVPLYVGAYNFNGSPFGFTDGNIAAFGIWDSVLDAATVATKNAQMAAL